MAKQLYELEIEEILRKCEEEAARECLPAIAPDYPGAETRSRPAQSATLFKIDVAEEREFLPKRRGLTAGQRTALGWLALIVGLVLYPYVPVVTALLLLVPMGLALAARRENGRS